MSLPSERIKPIDLGQALATAYALRNARQRNEAGDLELQQQRYAFDNQRQFQEALGRQDFDTARRLNPTAMAAIEAKQLDAQKDRSKLVDDRLARTQNLQKLLASRLRPDSTPEEIAAVRAIRDEKLKTGNYDRFDLPGDGDAFADVLPDAPEQRAQQVATFQRTAGVDPLAGLANDVKEYVQVTGDKVGSDGFGQRYTQWTRENRRSGATTINNNLKELPASQVNELADYQTAIESVDSLLENFRKNVASGGVADQLGSRVEAQIPNSSVSQYNDAARATMQAVGLILEGGKLAAGDEVKYAKLLPKPGDSDEVAAAKAANIKKLLATKAKNRGAALTGSGYRTPTIGAGEAPKDGAVSTEDKIARRVKEMERNKVPRAKQIQNLQAEKLLTPEQAQQMLQSLEGQ